MSCVDRTLKGNQSKQTFIPACCAGLLWDETRHVDELARPGCDQENSERITKNGQQCSGPDDMAGT